jgi:hypothetical protein
MCIYRMINSGRFTGLDWLDEDKTVFKVPWIHAKKRGYNRERDAALFREWAMHSGKYRQDSDPTVWKINFRCAINGLKDIMEIKDMQTEDCHVYKVLPSRSKRHRPKVARQRAEPYPTSCATSVQGKLEGSSIPIQCTQAGTEADTLSLTGQGSSRDASIQRFTPISSTTPTSSLSLELLQIKIFYGSVMVHDEYVDCTNRCRIVSSDGFLPPAEYKNIVLPENHPHSSARDIFNDMGRGVLIEAYNGSVYVTPRCRTVVYRGSSSGVMAQLRKEIRSKVFDYRENFRPDFEHYNLVCSLVPYIEPPIPYVILGLGQMWGSGRHFTKNLISIVITHIQAWHDIDKINLTHIVDPITATLFEIETTGISS